MHPKLRQNLIAPRPNALQRPPPVVVVLPRVIELLAKVPFRSRSVAELPVVEGAARVAAVGVGKNALLRASVAARLINTVDATITCVPYLCFALAMISPDQWRKIYHDVF